MSHSPLALAALASVAVPGLDVYDVLRSSHADADFDVVVVVDATGKRWTVRAPRRASAGPALEAELALLTSLATAHANDAITFDIPRPAGAVPTDNGGRAVVYEQIRGARLSLASLEPGPGPAASLGRAIAQIHELPHEIVEELGLPSYDAASHRERRLAELDAAIQTSEIPPALSDRWERQLERASLWHFEPTVLHGSLAEHRIIVADGLVAGILTWTESRIGDPADDLGWLVAAAPPDVLDTVMEAYHGARRELRDPHLRERANLASEMALARWLLHGVREGDEAIIEDARGMLADLEVLIGQDEMP